MHWNAKQVFAPLVVSLFIAVIVFYGYYQSRAIIEGPSISIETPENGITSATSLVAVKGVAKHAKELTLDDRPIFIDLNGRFSEQLLLMDGYNIIELAAKDNKGHIERKKIELVYRTETGQ